MATAMVSLLTGIPVRADVTMTGEVTLRGRVLPVGGVREKVLAALRRGIHQVILPEANQHDLEEVPHELARKLQFHFVRNMDEVLELALQEPILAKRKLRRAVTRAPAAIIRS
jgi:ATP-dependent Lon protease